MARSLARAVPLQSVSPQVPARAAATLTLSLPGLRAGLRHAQIALHPHRVLLDLRASEWVLDAPGDGLAQLLREQTSGVVCAGAAAAVRARSLGVPALLFGAIPPTELPSLLAQQIVLAPTTPAELAACERAARLVGTSCTVLLDLSRDELLAALRSSEAHVHAWYASSTPPDLVARAAWVRGRGRGEALALGDDAAAPPREAAGLCCTDTPLRPPHGAVTLTSRLSRVAGDRGMLPLGFLHGAGPELRAATITVEGRPAVIEGVHADHSVVILPAPAQAGALVELGSGRLLDGQSCDVLALSSVLAHVAERELIAASAGEGAGELRRAARDAGVSLPSPDAAGTERTPWRAYDAVGPLYDRYYAASEVTVEDQWIATRLREVAPGGRVVELACATGRLLDLLPLPPSHYLGVDAAASMVTGARAKHPSHRFVHTDALELLAGLPAESTDVVVATFGALSYLTEGEDAQAADRALARAIRRVLTQEGYLLVMPYGQGRSESTPHLLDASGFEQVPRRAWRERRLHRFLQEASPSPQHVRVSRTMIAGAKAVPAAPDARTLLPGTAHTLEGSKPSWLLGEVIPAPR